MSGEKNSKITKKGVIKIVVFILSILVIAGLWNAFLYSPVKVVGDSMEPAFSDGDIVIINKFSYSVEDIERYDVVMFPGEEDVEFVKRVIGLPKEKVEIIDGKIYINDERLREYYGVYDEDTLDLYADYGPVVLGETEFFVLGDNRSYSVDSRTSKVGAVDWEKIDGVLEFRIWPWNSIGALEEQ